MSETTATCAACGERQELCGSVKIDGVQQPRFCKACLINGMKTGDYGIKDELWIKQMIELGDFASIEALRVMEGGGR